MQTAIVVVAMAAFIAAAFIDVRRRRIPNALSYLIGSLGLLRILLAGDPVTGGWTLAAAAGVLVVGFMFFWGGTFGGGDAKLLTGAVLALVLLVGDRLIPRLRWVKRRAPVPDATAAAMRRAVWPTVPYGVAISAAGMIILVLQVSVSR